MTFEDAYREHSHAVKRWIIWRYGEDIADDAVQEGFFYAWQNWDQTDTITNLRAWLTGVAKYATKRMLRGGSTMRSTDNGDKASGIASFHSRAHNQTVEWNAETDMRAELPSQEMAIYVEQLRSHFGALGPAQKDAMSALAGGESAQEYADRTGRSQQAVSEAVRMGRRRLREALDDSRPFTMA